MASRHRNRFNIGKLTDPPSPPKNKRCPKCKSSLVARYGIWGWFFGCSNYVKTGCTYTVKYKQ